jgi:hypothetical protein
LPSASTRALTLRIRWASINSCRPPSTTRLRVEYAPSVTIATSRRHTGRMRHNTCGRSKCTRGFESVFNLQSVFNLRAPSTGRATRAGIRRPSQRCLNAGREYRRAPLPHGGRAGGGDNGTWAGPPSKAAWGWQHGGGWAYAALTSTPPACAPRMPWPGPPLDSLGRYKPGGSPTGLKNPRHHLTPLRCIVGRRRRRMGRRSGRNRSGWRQPPSAPCPKSRPLGSHPKHGPSHARRSRARAHPGSGAASRPSSPSSPPCPPMPLLPTFPPAWLPAGRAARAHGACAGAPGDRGTQGHGGCLLTHSPPPT